MDDLYYNAALFVSGPLHLYILADSTPEQIREAIALLQRLAEAAACAREALNAR